MTKLLIHLIMAGSAFGDGLFIQAIREDRLDRIKALSQDEQALRQADERGMTPLLWAAAVGSRQALELILQHPAAGVNTANKNGVTALMMAARDTAKARLLIEKGADVNAVSQDGVTPLFAALGGAGNAEVVKMLLNKGADPRTVTRARQSALLLAYRTRDPRIIQAFADAGVKLADKSDFGARPLNALGPSAPLEHIRALLDLGADPNELGQTLTLSFPVLASYANSNRLDAVKLLLERGANPNLQGNKGHTALMTAAGAVRRNPEMIKILLAAGADPQVKDAQGSNSLDWALKQGETELAALLRSRGARPAFQLVRPAALAEPRTATAALAKGLPLLVQAEATSVKKVACVNCHNNSLPAIALRAARDAGPALPADAIGHHARWYEKTNGRRWESALWLDFAASYPDWALVEEDSPTGIHTDSTALRLLRAQQPNGRWGSDGDSFRPPLSSTAIKSTAFSIRVLAAWAPPRLRTEARERIQRAAAFLEQAQAADTQELAFQMLGLLWAGGSSRLPELRDRLLALQREDGGWGQMPTMASDAYATGQALYALHAACGVPGSAQAYRRGVQYLLRNQLEDGSWFVPTRAFGFQPYYEGGFPHGVHQYLSASASSWAVMALTAARPGDQESQSGQ